MSHLRALVWSGSPEQDHVGVYLWATRPATRRHPVTSLLQVPALQLVLLESLEILEILVLLLAVRNIEQARRKSLVLHLVAKPLRARQHI
jgi:hypothetical protein